MQIEKKTLDGVPALLWGSPSEKVYLYVHGKLSCKEYAEEFAQIAEAKGYQTLSFDLPESGERKDGADGKRLDVWDGCADVLRAADYAFSHWKTVALYACSIGAYFSLQSLAERPVEKCLLQSPIVDMEWLARQMMLWFDVSEERLKKEGEIPTPVDPLRWEYFQYSIAHPVSRWPAPTSVLYAGRDALQSRERIRNFCERFGCRLTVSEESDHPFMEEKDGPIVRRWLEENV